jgi:hypothetical protein
LFSTFHPLVQIREIGRMKAKTIYFLRKPPF